MQDENYANSVSCLGCPWRGHDGAGPLLIVSQNLRDFASLGVVEIERRFAGSL